MAAKFTLITGARLIDGTGKKAVEQGAVLVEGDVIRAVGPAAKVKAPQGAQVERLDYKDATVMPGLIDCHVHMNGIGDGRAGDELVTLPDEVLTLQSAKNARAHLYNGVTTIRDCGGKNKTIFHLREAVKMGITPAPRIMATIRPMAIVGGHLSYFGIAATGRDECIAAVRQLVKEGADFIKITATGGSTRTSIRVRPSFNVDELKAIVDEAHKFGRHTVAHCVSSQGMLNVLEAGVDTIVHAIHQEADGEFRYRPDITEKLVKQGVFVNPTLSIVRTHMKNLEKKVDAGTATDAQQASLDELKVSYEAMITGAEKMRKAGVTIVCGSDTAWLDSPMGRFQEELEAEVEMGMTPMEAIVSATRDSSRSLWMEDKVGTLEAGKQADVLVVKGDPAKRINDLWNVQDVFLAGRKVDRGNFV
ncbi:MAG: amidohydrolase family protein [SAR202 cluster bacterium]|nr:amidohydrolase family protein [SAR202 cluster bacterium]